MVPLRSAALLLALPLCTLPAPLEAGPTTRLVVFEVADCAPCRLFRQEVLPAYWGSPASLDLPIQLIDMQALGTGGHPLRAPVVTLPTFVVMRDGREVARLAGYPGREGFAALVEAVIGGPPDSP